jgi:hypothetical protein
VAAFLLYAGATTGGDRAMLKLDNVPNTAPIKLEGFDNDLGGAPNYADVDFQSSGRDGERSMHFALWPAHVGEKQVNVRISTGELARISGDNFEINSVKISAALRTLRERIEQRANEKLKLTPDVTEITLDLDSLG